MLVKRDNNELRYNSIWLLQKQGNSDYYRQLFRNTKGFFYGMGREDLIDEMNKVIYETLERKLGAKIDQILLTYKYLPSPNSFTRSKVAGKESIDVRKFDLERWFDEVENWIFKAVITLEPDIMFSLLPKQYI